MLANAYLFTKVSAADNNMVFVYRSLLCLGTCFLYNYPKERLVTLPAGDIFALLSVAGIKLLRDL
jgi:1,4-dihydroxy-2-naphthoate octaprenyltransferase